MKRTWTTLLVLIVLAGVVTITAQEKNPKSQSAIVEPSDFRLQEKEDHTMTENSSVPTKQELKARLSPLQYHVTQEEGTEKPFDNPYWDEKREGIYVDIISGEPLFSSKDKYDSNTGWPSFTRPISADSLIERRDYKLIFPRTEVRSRQADSHLGHVFTDGPKPTGLRYCVNSASLRFIPKEQLAEEGYAELLVLFN